MEILWSGLVRGGDGAALIGRAGPRPAPPARAPGSAELDRRDHDGAPPDPPAG